MRFAYADPPYLGCCGKYEHYHPDGRCWDDVDTHRLLIDRLVTDYPDGWLLSLHTPSLRTLLPLCPDDVRIGAWVKPFHAYHRFVRPAYAWEPVIYRGGRNDRHVPKKGEEATTPKDFVSANITLGGIRTATPTPTPIGGKPDRFCRWVLDVLGYRDGDELDDLYPGTGVMARVLSAPRLL